MEFGILCFYFLLMMMWGYIVTMQFEGIWRDIKIGLGIPPFMVTQLLSHIKGSLINKKFGEIWRFLQNTSKITFCPSYGICIKFHLIISMSKHDKTCHPVRLLITKYITTYGSSLFVIGYELIPLKLKDYLIWGFLTFHHFVEGFQFHSFPFS